MYQWTDEQGVVHFSSEAPEGVNAKKLDDTDTRANRGAEVSWRDQYAKICKSRVSLHGYSSNLLEVYLDDLERIKEKALQEAGDEEKAEAQEERFEKCRAQVRSAIGSARNREAAEERDGERAKAEEDRFKRLQEVVGVKLEERRKSRKAYAREGIKFYSDLKHMEAPLRYGMSMDEVKSKWHEPLRISKSGSSSGEYEYWYYPMDIRLRFKDGILTYWYASY
jgi:hypothetical protein